MTDYKHNLWHSGQVPNRKGKMEKEINISIQYGDADFLLHQD